MKDATLASLVEKHGMVDLPYGQGYRSVVSLVSRFKKNPWKGIDLIMSVPEYAEDGSAKKELAKAMQPYWSKWWDTFNIDDVDYYKTASIVLGHRQIYWINAQLARMVIDINEPNLRELCLEQIGYAEQYAAEPDSDSLEEVMTLGRVLRESAEVDLVGNSLYAARCAAMAASVIVSGLSDSFALTAISLEDYGYYNDIRASRRCSSLVRSVMTPTLVTDPLR